ncbi:MAG: hypothetical protein HFH94_14905 [Lachnospiraceae bacterium]|nr:hypothetical protein [Lachnospiraceae bacterium]
MGRTVRCGVTAAEKEPAAAEKSVCLRRIEGFQSLQVAVALSCLNLSLLEEDFRLFGMVAAQGVVADFPVQKLLVIKRRLL